MLFLFCVFVICKENAGTMGQAPRPGTLLGCFRSLPGSSGAAPGTLLNTIGRSRAIPDAPGTLLGRSRVTFSGGDGADERGDDNHNDDNDDD